MEADGGRVLAAYREPLGGHAVLFAALPVDKVQPTPYQRDLSEPHVKRLVSAMERVDRFLDPLIAVRHEGSYWTPNGNHRLAATRALGGQTVLALLIPEPEVAFQILALNTEKAHNLKERSLEVIRMLRGLLETRKGTELDVAPLLEEPAFATLGAAYEKRPRLSGGAPTTPSSSASTDSSTSRWPRRSTIREERADDAAEARRRGHRRGGPTQGTGDDQPVPPAVRGGADQLPALREAQAGRRRSSSTPPWRSSPAPRRSFNAEKIKESDIQG